MVADVKLTQYSRERRQPTTIRLLATVALMVGLSKAGQELQLHSGTKRVPLLFSS
jgi:hypothetical protein